MSTVAPLMLEAVENGVFPYGEWAVFRKSGVIETGATEGQGGRLFDLASLTKTFTATAVLALCKEGALSLGSGAYGLLGTENGELENRLRGISVFSLLTHTSGLPAWYPFYADGREFFDILCGLPAGEPGMVYSDIGYMLLREILCRRTGLRFEELISRYVSGPLGLGVRFRPGPAPDVVPSCRDNAVEERMCRERGFEYAGFRAHFTDVIGEPNDGNAHYYFNDVSGHAGLFGTAMDAAGLGLFYLRCGDAAFLGGVEPQDGCSGRCLVFHTGGAFPSGCGHTGFTGTSIWLDREADIGLALLTNRLYYDHLPTADMNAFRRRVHEALLAQILI